MTESVKDSVSANAAALLIHYSFDLNGYTADELVTSWATTYQPLWVRSAVIEALYQGRYKAISVEQILVLWLRRGQPLYHFNHEFERIVCSKFPQLLVPKAPTEGAVAALPPPKFPPQSHWRYLLPGMTNTDNIPVAPVMGSNSWVAASAGMDEELSRGSEPVNQHRCPEEGHGEGQTGKGQLQEERSQPEMTHPTNAECSGTSTFTPSALNPSTDSSAVETAQTAAEPTLPEVVAGLPPTTGPVLPQTHPIRSELFPTEPGIATDVSLESVLAEADRLLENLEQRDRDSSSVESAVANQAKPEPIHQFVPITESSEFYSKLKAVAQPPEDSVAVSESFSASEPNSRRA